MFKSNKYISILLIGIMVVLLVGCNKKETTVETKTVPKKSYPISMSASINDYSEMDKDERKAACEDKYIEISGVVYRDDDSFKIVSENSDGIEVGCAFDNYTNEITEITSGDYITISGLCSSSFDDSMFLYECEVVNIVKNGENEKSEDLTDDNEYLASSDVEISNDFQSDINENDIVSDRNVEVATEEVENNSSEYIEQETTNSNNDNYVNSEENKDSAWNDQQSNPDIDYSQGRYAVNDKNGKIHAVGECVATNGSGNQLMTQPVFFDTIEEAENYSAQYHPQQEKRRCQNCWKN